jgi:hypothetical protein
MTPTPPSIPIFVELDKMVRQLNYPQCPPIATYFADDVRTRDPLNLPLISIALPMCSSPVPVPSLSPPWRPPARSPRRRTGVCGSREVRLPPTSLGTSLGTSASTPWVLAPTRTVLSGELSVICRLGYRCTARSSVRATRSGCEGRSASPLRLWLYLHVHLF